MKFAKPSYWDEINSGTMPRTMRSLTALAMGDAYGVAFEFMDSKEISKNYPHIVEVSLGGGPFGFQQGAFSDDTEMAALTLYSLHTRGCVDVEHIRNLYVAWAHVARDIGIQTRQALLENTIDYSGEGNGALMRILPAVAYMHEIWGYSSAKIKNQCAAISAITHDNQRIHAVNDFFIDVMLERSLGDHAELMAMFSNTDGTDGWVMNTARIVYDGLKSPSNFIESLWSIAKLGGDTDTACAIYGAIRGFKEQDLMQSFDPHSLLNPLSMNQLRTLFDISLHRYTPIPNEDRLIAGQYPGARDAIAHAIKLVSLIDEGVEVIVNLMEPDELLRFTPYEEAMRQFNPNLIIEHHPIRDMDTPTLQTLENILDTLKKYTKNKKVYVHCWGGHGRTGTVVGAYLVEQGMSASQALEQIRVQRFKTPFGNQPSPQTREQVAAVWSRCHTIKD